MTQEALSEVMENLRQDEALETQMIGLYLTLLDIGIEQCLPEDEQAAFRRQLELVHEQSKQHKAAIQGLIKKYGH